jgi:hypothetical protein
MSKKCGSMQMSGGRTRGRRQRRQRGRNQRGGVGNAASGDYSDGASYVLSKYGDGNQQWDRTFVQGSQWGNQLTTIDGSQPSSPLSFYNSQKGGRRRGRSQRRQRQQQQQQQQQLQQSRSQRRQRGQSRSKKGGFFGAVLQDALVPFGLFAAQNAYAKRTRKHRK